MVQGLSPDLGAEADCIDCFPNQLLCELLCLEVVPALGRKHCVLYLFILLVDETKLKPLASPSPAPCVAQHAALSCVSVCQSFGLTSCDFVTCSLS